MTKFKMDSTKIAFKNLSKIAKHVTVCNKFATINSTSAIKD